MRYRFSLLAVCVTAALTPAYVVRWRVGPIPTTLLELSILATMAIFAYETVRQRSRIEWRGPLTLPASAFLAAGALSVVVSGDHRAALGLYRAYFLEPAAFALIIATVAWTPRRVGAVVLGFAAGGVAVALLNAALVLDAIRRHVLDLATTPPVAVYQTANDVPLYLVPIAAVAASLLLHSTEGRERLLSAIYLAIALPACILSFSRGGFIAIAAIVLALALTHRWWRLFLPAAVVAGVVVSQLPLIRHRIAYELHPIPGNTLDFRIRIWGQTLRLLSHHPILGIGLSYYQQAMGPFWQDLPRVIYPHNVLLNFWAVMGLPGLIGFAWLSGQAFVLSWRGWRSDATAWRPYELGVFLFLIGLLAHGLVDVPFFKNDLSLEYWALLGILWAASRWRRVDGSATL